MPKRWKDLSQESAPEPNGSLCAYECRTRRSPWATVLTAERTTPKRLSRELSAKYGKVTKCRVLVPGGAA